MKTIVARITLDGGSLLTAKNAHRIIARSTKPTDRYGNALDKNGRSPLYRFRDDPPYFRRWVIKKEKEGFTFREVSGHSGICGHAKSVRQLVVKTLCGFSAMIGGHIIVEVLDEQPAAEPVLERMAA